MKKMLFTGDLPVLLPTLDLLVHQGDTVDVPDDFDAEGFSEVAPAPKAAPASASQADN